MSAGNLNVPDDPPASPSKGAEAVTPSAPVKVHVIDETNDNEVEADKGALKHQVTGKEGTGLKETPSKGSSLKRMCRRLYRKFGIKHMLILLMMALYTIIGAAIFIALEKDDDQKVLNEAYKDYEQERRYFAANLTQRVIRLFQTGRLTELRVLIDKELEGYDQRQGNVPSTSEESLWSFWNAMYFAGTIYTTIGYGDMYCRTTSGRIFTMFYSLIGIPLMLITLTDLGGVLLKMMLGITSCWENCKSKYSPRALFGPHPPGFYDKPVSGHRPHRTDTAEGRELEMMEKGRGGVEDEEVDDLYELEKREEDEYEEYLTKVPISTALFVTVGWIFICAGLFCAWEEWSYFTSVYFFFISLSTIGLGDETPTRKDVMVATYALVIIGLSLVSMCITVIQRRLEDLYLHLLQIMLQEYQKGLLAGGDQLGATVGMMQAWQKNMKARFLMPLLSKDKKKTVAKKFQDEAKSQGIILPPVLRDLDPRTGIPAVFRATENKVIDGPAQLNEAVAGAIQRAADKARVLNEPVEDNLIGHAVLDVQEEEPAVAEKATPISAPPAAPINYDADTQTDELETEDKQEQTMLAPHVDAQTQSVDSSFASDMKVDETSQTPIIEYDDASAQCQLEDDTKKVEGTEQECQTDTADVAEASVQTSKASSREQELQTHLYDLAEVESQTEPVETRNQRLQTPVPEILEQEAQTEPLILDPELFQVTGTLSMASNKKGWAKAKENFQQAIKKMHTSNSKSKLPVTGLHTVPSLAGVEATPAMASWDDVVEDEDDIVGKLRRPRFYGNDDDDDEEDELTKHRLRKTSRWSTRKQSEESLHWDPFDGLHCEQQRKVGDLKKMFEPSRMKRRSHE